MGTSYPVLKKGDTGAAVERVQKVLSEWWGILCKVDGDFGPATEKAVKQFQGMRQSSYEYAGEPLAQDSVVGAKTWAELLKVPVAEVARVIVQEAESELGFGDRSANKNAIALMHAFEGCKLKAYLCPANVWTIGWGTTKGVRPGMTITQAQANKMFQRDLEKFENAVQDLVKVPLNDDQFGALVSFVYNIGEDAFAGSTLLRLLNQGKYDEAANQFLVWNKGGGRVLPGLERRRKAERALFKGEDFRRFL